MCAYKSFPKMVLLLDFILEMNYQANEPDDVSI
jgi:hypothetical protein